MRTVFVIGAGANVEIGMPSGDELKTKIAKLLNFSSNKRPLAIGGDTLIDSAIDMYAYADTGSDAEYFDNFKALTDAAKIISKAMPLSISIDSFIEAQKENCAIAFCGKLAIVRLILDAERDCSLSTAYDENSSLMNIGDETAKLHNSWYPSLFKKITEGCSIEELTGRLNNISFIIFNYDRCFEYFIYNALITYYCIGHEKAKEFIQKLNIVHPYGTVGDLWDDKSRFTFGETPDVKKLVSLAQRIKTFTESGGVDQKEDIASKVKYLVDRADRIIFLGFAYHNQNLDLLFKQRGIIQDAILPSESITCYGTGYQISENDLVNVRKLLMQANKKIKECIISETDITCAQFFKNFWYTLSFKETE